MLFLAGVRLAFVPFHDDVILMMQLNIFVQFIKLVVHFEVVDQLNRITLDLFLPFQEFVRLRQIFLVHIGHIFVFLSYIAVVDNHVLQRLLAFPIVSVSCSFQGRLISVENFFVDGTRIRRSRLI